MLRSSKIYSLFIIQFLIIGLFANSLLSHACLCGGACQHGIQVKERTSLSFLFHARCLGAKCKSCNFEDIQTFKASNAAHSTSKIQILSNSFYIFNFSDYQCNINLRKIIISRYNNSLKTHSPPAYLQKLSLLI